MNKKYFLLTVLIINALAATAQEKAATETGRQVLLYPDGRWEYAPVQKATDADIQAAGEAKADEMEREADALVAAAERQAAQRTSSIFMGGRRLLAGRRTTINSQADNFSTSVNVAKDGDRTMVIFWQDTDDHKINFFEWNWTGTVYLYLANGETIALTDRGMHGQNKIPNSQESSYGIKRDLYQRFSGHYLTLAECQKLKRSELTRVSYRTTEAPQSTVYLDVSENADTLYNQLVAIGR